MIQIELRFPAHRYHANPWGRHVNEGVAEWPPSPYRFLRALYDVWQRKCASIPEDTIRSLFSKLARELPEFDLPPATASHTRAYLSSNTEDVTDKSLIFDGFMVFGPDAGCVITWPQADLKTEEQRALQILLEGLNYLGRSESWVQAQVITGSDSSSGVKCVPADRATDGGTIIQVACVLPEEQYREKRPWLDALTFSTTELAKGRERRSDPPLLQRIRYVLPADAMGIRPVRSQRESSKVQTMLLRLDGKVLPLATSTIELAEQIRRRLMGGHRRTQGGDESAVSPLFSGKSPGGEMDREHAHLYILPQPNPSGRIDSVLLVSRKRPFTGDERRAVMMMRSFYQGDGRGDLRCVLVDEELAGSGRLLQLTSGPVISATPFVTPRHSRKGRGVDWLKQEVKRECQHHGLDEPTSVEFFDSEGPFQWVEYRRNRKQDPSRPGFGFRLRFDAPVAAPFAIGYGAHFGLGQFVSEERRTV